MKFLIGVLLSLGLGFSALAADIDGDLQAVILDSRYPVALEQAKAAVEALGDGQIRLGETSTLKFHSRDYYFYIPVYAVSVPSFRSVSIGSIVANLTATRSSVTPQVLGIYFSPAPQAP